MALENFLPSQSLGRRIPRPVIWDKARPGTGKPYIHVSRRDTICCCDRDIEQQRELLRIAAVCVYNWFQLPIEAQWILHDNRCGDKAQRTASGERKS